MKNYHFLELQIALFFRENLSERPDKISVDINNTMSNIFDEIPLILPISNDAPGDFPILQLKASNNIYQCNVSRIRADFFYRPQDEKELVEDFSKHKGSFEDKLNHFFDIFLRYTEIKRIGYITKFFVADENPVKFIKKTFIKKDLKELHDVSIRFNKREKKELFELNNITNLFIGEMNHNNKKGLIIQRDINTIQEEDYSFDKKLFKSFVEESENHFSFSQIKQIIE